MLSLENRCCFHIKIDRYSRKPDQSMHRHHTNCCYFQKLGQICSSPCDSKIVSIDLRKHSINAVLNNCRVTDQNNNWLQLRFLDADCIKNLKAKINNDLKA